MTCPHHFVRLRQPAIGLACSFIAFALSCLAQPKAGDIIFQTDFEGAGALREWGAEQSPDVRLAAGLASAQSLLVERRPGASNVASVRVPLPVEKMRGSRLTCRAMVKADGVTEPPQPWNGIKFMLHVRAPGGDVWPQPNNVSGTFDWKRVQFKAAIPADATAAELILGLEAVSGRAQFDDLEITVARGPRARLATPPAGPVFTGHDEPRLRGAMIAPGITPESLRLLGREWNANLIRWQLIRYGPAAKITEAADYEAWLEGALSKLDAALPLCEQYGARVVLDLHSPFGGTPTVSGYVGTDTGLFTNRVRDCINLFEEFGWDWSYHAFREWNGWSVEHGPDKGDAGPSQTPTDREKLLREWYGKNVKTK